MMKSRNPEIRIPTELWFVILSFLPVKTLLRFRAVSKSFLALIDDPKFVSFHLRSFPANRHETHLFVLTQKKFQIHETAMGGALIGSFETGFPGSYRFVHGSIDGLVLLTDGRFQFILLWNPSTRKTRRLPVPLWCVSEGESHSALIGYDHLRRDYKVLLRQLHYTTKPGHLGLYSVSKGSWKTLDNEGAFGGLIKNLHKGVSFDGGVGWIELDYGEDHQPRQRLGLFDFGTETARYTALPSATTTDTWYRPRSNLFGGGRYEYNLFRVDGGRGLGLLAGGEVWELEMEKMTWISQYKIGEEFMSLRFLVVRKEKGELVFSRWLENRRLQVGSYNVETKEMKICEGIPQNALDLGVHVESLVKF